MLLISFSGSSSLSAFSYTPDCNNAALRFSQRVLPHKRFCYYVKSIFLNTVLNN